MPPESPTPSPDKVRKTRSFGSFMLFMFVLIVVVGYFMSNSLNRPTELSQDEYLYALYTGSIDRQEFQGTENGTTVIRGEFRLEDDPATLRPFETKFPDVAKNADYYRELKVGGTPRKVDAEALDQLFFAGLVAGLTQTPGSPIEGRDPAEIVAQAGAPGPERLLDLQIRTGPWGDAYGANPEGRSD